MYVPESFREADRSIAFDLIDAYGFATMVSQSEFKLSQNKQAADREGALRGLESEADAESRGLAAFARHYFERSGK